jgi:hypothetical protein
MFSQQVPPVVAVVPLNIMPMHAALLLHLVAQAV